MTRITVLNLLVCLLCFSCKDEPEIIERSDFQFESIEFSRICGWCVGGEKINISRDQSITYTEFNPCDPEIITLTKNRNLNFVETNRVEEIFDFETFKDVELNECGACYDGCEDMLTIVLSESESHSILFDDIEDEKLEPIHELVSFVKFTRDGF